MTREESEKPRMPVSEKVLIFEPYSFRVRDFIYQEFADGNNSMLPATATGEDDTQALDEPQESLGLVWLYRNDAGKKGFIGVIDLTNTLPYVTDLAEAEWIIRGYGRENVGVLVGLAERLSDQFNKKVGFYLQSENEKSLGT